MGLPRIDRSRMFGGNKKRRSHYWRGGQSRCHFQSADPGQSRRPRGPLASGRSEAVIYTVDVGRSRHPHLLHTLFQSRWLSPAAITDGSSRAYWNHWCGGANYGFCRHIATLSHCHIVTIRHIPRSKGILGFNAVRFLRFWGIFIWAHLFPSHPHQCSNYYFGNFQKECIGR